MIVETGSDELEHIFQPVPWATNKRAKDRIGKNRITRTSFCYVSRGDCISQVTQIRLTSPELSKPDNLKTNKITQPLHLPSYLNQTIRLPSYQIRPYASRVTKLDHTSPELMNKTIHPPSYEKFWHTCIITPDPLCAKVPKLICISHVVNRVEG